MITPSPGTIRFQEKVRRLLSKQNGKPVLNPNRPLVLKDSVAIRKPHKDAATCITEMSVLMACWKNNNFVDDFCSSEIGTFYKCIKETQAQAEEEKKKAEQGRMADGTLTSKQVNVLLKRFPNWQQEI